MQPKIWQQNSQATFESGEAEGVSLTRDGTVTLSPGLQVVADTEAAFVWSLVEGPQGDLYVGTGNQGRIYRVKVGADAELIFDSPDVAIFSLAVGSDGALYAGSSPDGV
ncbi:MAG: hypothetical protein O7G87_11640, partial [bacterium]|nr:hypothetical protein [bacterium]